MERCTPGNNYKYVLIAEQAGLRGFAAEHFQPGLP